MPLNAFEYVQSVIRKSLVRKRISLLVGEIRQLGGKFDLSNMRDWQIPRCGAAVYKSVIFLYEFAIQCFFMTQNKGSNQLMGQPRTVYRLKHVFDQRAIWRGAPGS